MPKTLIRCLLWAVLTYVIAGGFARPMRVRGISMEPTLHDGSLRFTHMWALKYRAPRRGEMVAIAMPGPRSFYAKRIVGLPGERIAFLGGDLLINGEAYPEPYLTDKGDWTVDPVVVPPGEYYVVGDNRTRPMAEQVAGLVEQRFITGVIW